MILDWGKKPSPPTIKRIFDANGIELPNEAVSINTETGDMEFYLKDDKGKYIIDYEKKEVKRGVVKVAAPVTVIFESENV